MSWLVAGAALWFCTDIAWAAYDFAHGIPAQGALMSVYALLAAWGWCEWRKQRA